MAEIDFSLGTVDNYGQESYDQRRFYGPVFFIAA
jgi:hypothetical protein